MSVGLYSFLKALGEIYFLAFSNFYRLPTFLDSQPLHLQSQQLLVKSFTLCYSLFCLSLLPYRNPCDYIGPKQIIQDDLLILRHLIINLNSPLPCNITYTEVLGIRLWTSVGQGEVWRGIFLPTTVVKLKVKKIS